MKTLSEFIPSKKTEPDGLYNHYAQWEWVWENIHVDWPWKSDFFSYRNS